MSGGGQTRAMRLLDDEPDADATNCMRNERDGERRRGRQGEKQARARVFFIRFYIRFRDSSGSWRDPVEKIINNPVCVSQ